MEFEVFKPKRYADLGKTLGESGFGDFGTPPLDRSDDSFVVQISKKYQDVYTVNFRSGYTLISDELQNGIVTVALVQQAQSTIYYYIQLQKRNEREFFRGGGDGRDFNQARFIEILKEDIDGPIRKRASVYSGLFSEKLKDYTVGGSIKLFPPVKLPKINTAEHPYVEKIVNYFYAQVIEQNLSPSLTIVTPHLSISQRLALIDSVQYYLFPLFGVMTFRLDVISSDYTVMLTVLDKVPPRPVYPQNLKQLENLEISESPNYYEFISTLSPSRFFSVIHLIKERLPLSIILDVLEVETLGHFNAKESVRRISQYLEQPLQRRYAGRLIHKLLKIQNTDLATYYGYHLAVINGQKNNVGFMAELRKALLRVTTNSLESSLDEIPEELHHLIYKELFITDFLSNKTLLKFKDNKNYLHAIMTRDIEKYLKGLDKLYDTNYKKNVIEKTLKYIDNGGECHWKISDILKFWNVISEFKNKASYVYFLSWILETLDEHSITSEDEIPLLLKGFVVEGQDIFQTKTLLSGLMGTNMTRAVTIAPILRQTGVRLCASGLESGLHYASWWLVAELAMSNHLLLEEDFVQILKKANRYDYINSYSAVKFLFTSRELGSYCSIYSACEQITKEEGYSQILPIFYRSIVRTWIKCEYVIPAPDIEILVQQLPQVEANQILANIIKSDSKRQKFNIQSISSKNAVRWMQAVESKEQDQLYKILLHLEKPEDDFFYYLLFEREHSFSKEYNWDNYIEYINNDIIALCDRAIIPEESHIYRAIEIAKIVRPPSKMESNYQKILEMIAHNNLDLPTDASLNSYIKSLLIMERFEKDERVRSIVCGILNEVEVENLRGYLTNDVEFFLGNYKERQK